MSVDVLVNQQARDALDAVRLALEAGTDDASTLGLVREIVERGPAADPDSTVSVGLLIAAVKEAGGRVVVQDGFGRAGAVQEDTDDG